MSATANTLRRLARGAVARSVIKFWTTPQPIEGSKVFKDRRILMLVYGMDWVIWLSYIVERKLLQQQHKKYDVHKVRSALTVHATSGFFEILLGVVALMFPQEKWARVASVLTALCFHIPSGLRLAPHSWGLKYVSVPGYYTVGLLRLWKAILFMGTGKLEHMEATLTLIHIAALVRFVTFLVVPFSTVGRHARRPQRGAHYPLRLALRVGHVHPAPRLPAPRQPCVPPRRRGLPLVAPAATLAEASAAGRE